MCWLSTLSNSDWMIKGFTVFEGPLGRTEKIPSTLRNLSNNKKSKAFLLSFSAECICIWKLKEIFELFFLFLFDTGFSDTQIHSRFAFPLLMTYFPRAILYAGTFDIYERRKTK